MTFFLRLAFWTLAAFGIIWLPALLSDCSGPNMVDPAKCSVGVTCDVLRH